jgi:hypothetical protein
LASGEHFAGFGIVRLLGVGGMGEVYLVEHPRLPRREALKALTPGLLRLWTFMGVRRQTCVNPSATVDLAVYSHGLSTAVVECSAGCLRTGGIAPGVKVRRGRKCRLGRRWVVLRYLASSWAGRPRAAKVGAKSLKVDIGLSSSLWVLSEVPAYKESLSPVRSGFSGRARRGPACSSHAARFSRRHDHGWLPTRCSRR